MKAPEAGALKGGWPAAASLILLSALLSLWWSHVRLLWNDEFLSFYSDSVPTLKDVLLVQLRSPISLDPPTYHLLSHLSMEMIGRNAMALRLPALLGFLLMQASVFLLVRRLASVRAGLIAMALPMLTASFRYSVEGRPYGWLLGLYAFSLLCWYSAARSGDFLEARILPLAGLVSSIALAISSHYFGVLILIPVSLGEIARTVSRRRFDWPMVAALAGGMATVGLILPFERALLPYRQHYYTSAVNLHNVSQGFREIFVRYNAWPMATQRVTAFLLSVAVLALAVAAVRRYRTRPEQEPVYLWTALAGFAALPFFGYLFGKFVTHTMEVRYVVAALVAFVVTLPLTLEVRLRSRGFFYGLLCAIIGTSIAVDLYQSDLERRAGSKLLATFAISSPLRQELLAHPTEKIYTQSLNDLFLNSYYAQDPLVRDRISLVYDETSEVRWLHHNTNAVTAIYMQRFTTLPVSRYEEFLAQSHPFLLEYGSGWEWIGKDLKARGVAVRPEGEVLRGKLEEVQIGMQ